MTDTRLNGMQTTLGVTANALMWFGLYAGMGVTVDVPSSAGGAPTRLLVSAGILIAFAIIAAAPALIGNKHARRSLAVLFAVSVVFFHTVLADVQSLAGITAINLVRGLDNGFAYAQMGVFLFMLTAEQSVVVISIAMLAAGAGAFLVGPMGFDTVNAVLMCTQVATLLLFLAVPVPGEKRVSVTTVFRTAPHAVPLYVELFLLSIVYGLIVVVASQFNVAAEIRSAALVNPSAAYLGAAAVLCIAALCRKRIDFFSIRWVLLPLMAASLVPLLVGSFALALVFELILLGLFQFLEASSTVALVEIDREYGLAPISSFATLRVAGTLGILLGRTLALGIVAPSLDAAIANGASMTTSTFEATIAIILMALILWRAFLKYPSFEYGAVPAGSGADDVPAGASQPEERSEKAPGASVESEREQPDTAKTGVWKRKCSSFSQRYGLSAREQDVLRLLARGRNAVFIGKELYISESTVRTHISHIYQKADVHSQQQLIDLVEQQQA